MSEETKITQEEQQCFCKSKCFKKFLTVALGTFVGGFCAISLFAALNKPPMMPMMPMMHKGYYHHMMGGHHFKKHNCDCPCHKKMMKKHFKEGKMPNGPMENKLPEADD